MEETKQKRKPKRVLKDINFENESAHLALVHREQGGPANGADYKLVVKSTTQYSDEFLEKAAAIKVEYDLNEYLLKFYESDQDILMDELGEEVLESSAVMKRLYEAESITDVLANLSEQEYLQLLQDQAKVEKAFKNIEKEYKKKVRTKEKEPANKESTEKEVDKEHKESTEVAKATEGDTSPVQGENVASATNSTNVDVEKSEGTKPSVVKQKKKESKPMTETVHVAEKEVELVEKSQFDEIQKAFDAQKEELQKALDLVNELKKEKQEAIAKARKQQLAEVAGDKAEVLFKACGEVDEQVFADVIKALGEMKAQVEKSKMFEEVGASVEEETATESPIAKALQARLANKQ